MNGLQTKLCEETVQDIGESFVSGWKDILMSEVGFMKMWKIVQ